MKIIPKNLFKSKKTRSPSFTSSAATTTASPDSHRGASTPTSVLPPSVSSDWSDASNPLQFDLLQAFNFIDVDGDGKITTQELESILYRILGSESESGSGSDSRIREELALMLSEIDKNGDGVITIEEFGVMSAVFGAPAGDDELREVFDVFDADHDGRITAEELFAVFKTVLGHERCSLEECVCMIRNVDKNNDGVVCFQDFTRMMDQQQR